MGPRANRWSNKPNLHYARYKGRSGTQNWQKKTIIGQEHSSIQHHRTDHAYRHARRCYRTEGWGVYTNRNSPGALWVSLLEKMLYKVSYETRFRSNPARTKVVSESQPSCAYSPMSINRCRAFKKLHKGIPLSKDMHHRTRLKRTVVHGWNTTT